VKRWDKDGRQIGDMILTGQSPVFSLVALSNGELLSSGHDGSTKRLLCLNHCKTLLPWSAGPSNASRPPGASSEGGQ
jgi:hypothetical protein